MRLVVIAAVTAIACTEPNGEHIAPECEPVEPECRGDCTLLTGYDRPGNAIERIWTEPNGAATWALYYDDGTPLMHTRTDADGNPVLVEWCWPSGALAFSNNAAGRLCYTANGAAYDCEYPPGEVADIYHGGFTYRDETIFF